MDVTALSTDSSFCKIYETLRVARMAKMTKQTAEVRDKNRKHFLWQCSLFQPLHPFNKVKSQQLSKYA